jgi:hypothetical protein
MQRTIFLMLSMWLLLIAVVVLPPPRRALACTPPPGGLPVISIAERTQAAELVIEGQVIGLADANGIPGSVATLQVRQYLKGSGPDQLIASGFGPQSLCLSELQLNDVRVVYLVNDGAGGLRALYLSQFDAVAPATAFLISQVQAAANGAPVAAVQAAPAQQPAYPYPYPVPATAVPTLPPPTFIPPTFAPVATPSPTLPAITQPLPTAAPPDLLPTIGSPSASETGVPIPATSIGWSRSVGPFSVIIGALALAAGVAYLRRRLR